MNRVSPISFACCSVRKFHHTSHLVSLSARRIVHPYPGLEHLRNLALQFPYFRNDVVLLSIRHPSLEPKREHVDVHSSRHLPKLRILLCPCKIVLRAFDLFFVNSTAVAHSYNQHPQLRVPQFANDLGVAHSVSPQSKFAMTKRLPARARFFGLSSALLHVVQNLPLYLAIQLFEIGEDPFVIFNLPSQAPSEPARRYKSCRAFRDGLPPDIGLRDPRGFPR
jgi:hypothetical protein